MDSQNKLWLRCPPPWSRTRVRLSSGRASRSPSSSWTGRSAHAVPSSAALRPATSTMVLVVVDAHRQLVDRGLQRAIRIRERRQYVRHATSVTGLGVVPGQVVRPGLLGGWGLSRPPSPRRTSDGDIAQQCQDVPAESVVVGKAGVGGGLVAGGGGRGRRRQRAHGMQVGGSLSPGGRGGPAGAVFGARGAGPPERAPAGGGGFGVARGAGLRAR